ncbi:MAG: hypothetical protein ABW067_16385 [Rhizobacter sp.]
MILRSISLAAIGLCLVHGAAFALTDAEFQPASQAFRAASAGDDTALDTATTAFDAMRKAEPANPVPVAYGGALEAMRARTTMLPWRKVGHAEDGMAALDKALAMLTPAHDTERLAGTSPALLVKFTAASTFLAVPALMNRGARGRRLLDEVQAHPAFPTASAGFREAVARAAAKQAEQAARSVP